MSMIDFLSLSRKFRVNKMLRLGHIRNRIEDGGEGMSYTEFSYQILQAYDWYNLSSKYDCHFQVIQIF